MELELHFPQPVGDVDVVYAFHEHCPRMCVVFGRACRFWIVWTEQPGCGAVHERPKDLYAFDAFLVVGWRHFDAVLVFNQIG